MSINWENLEIEQLRSASLLDPGVTRGPVQMQPSRIPECIGEFNIIRTLDVLYDPTLRQQVLPGGVVPVESLDAWTLDFVRGSYSKEHFRAPFRPRRLPLEVCVLSNMTSRNFMHWTTEQMLKVIVLEQNGFTGTYVVSDQPNFSFQFLDAFGVPKTRILDVGMEPTVFDSAIFTTAVTAEDYLRYRGLFFLLREELLSIANHRLAERPRRIWLDRKLSVRNPRDFINGDEIYSLIASYGFTVVDMAAHDVRDQIAIANGCEALMGMHGAGFVHSMFMNLRSKVIECFSPEFINTGFWEICTLMHHRYAMVVHNNAYGAYEHGWGLKVIPLQLELVLRSLDLEPIG